MIPIPVLIVRYGPAVIRLAKLAMVVAPQVIAIYQHRKAAKTVAPSLQPQPETQTKRLK